ncbi:MAG: 23S rRNA (guanosine(2251)-2'-O)-methyltransferase RlmB [Candidatus Mcinerneyibacterium aminivorans]|uniref:23S rRNA (Guanosine(2251)-2'-O)-methyltransferase RlmB n=1 Tax=Candidatus Mcinerneyibacterium aminivorans TaxID=2703815 RepID=A0A5D0MJC4_9BACT|nr:MAG: 23S rRNA (guanosine(2251)-2'-O)-methyltransferase RlmB [Candidatus Mcinerneyibacterium aminivorans]
MLIYGKNVFLETIKHNYQIVKNIYIKKGAEDYYLSLLEDKKKVTITEKNFFQKNLKYKKHQNVALEINSFPLKNHRYLENNFKQNSIYLLLDSIKDPNNLGNIIRTAYGLEIDGIIITKDRTAGITPAVFSASAGYVNRLPVIEITNPANMIKMFKKWTYWTAYVDMDGEKNIKSSDFNIPLPLIVAFGSEGSGVRDLYKKKCDFSLSIPQRKDFDSFNLSIAAGITMWELSKMKK